MLIKDLKELIVTLDKSSVQHFEMENSEVKLKISKNQGTMHQAIAEQAVEVPTRLTETAVETQMQAELEDPSIEIIHAPMVGVFYEAPNPESAPFVQVGTVVEAGQPLCIIEAMKIMNEIEADVSGEIVELLVDNEDVVEYGQPLMKIRRV